MSDPIPPSVDPESIPQLEWSTTDTPSLVESVSESVSESAEEIDVEEMAVEEMAVEEMADAASAENETPTEASNDPVTPVITGPVTVASTVASTVVPPDSVPAGSVPVQAVVPPAVRNNSSLARLALMVGCGILALTTVFLVSRNYQAPVNSTPAAPVPVAQNPTPANAPENTVVAPLARVAFTPGPPEAPGDLVVYKNELMTAARPYLDIAPTGIIENPEVWSSHFYGPSDLPASQSPPVDASNEALCMVAQINLADLPAMPTPDKVAAGPIHRLPNAGVLQFWLAMMPAGSPTGWTGGPTFHDTVNQAAQRVTYISEADMAAVGVQTIPQSSRCSDGPPARGAAVPLGLSFSVQWHVPETTDSRFSTAMPYLAGALSAADSNEFYRALGSINSYLGSDSGAQLGGFNRLVEQDPRSIDALAGEGARDGRVTDLFEVLLEIHTTQDADDAWAIGFGSQGSGGWWVDPDTLAKLNASGQIPSAFWWDSQPVPVEEETQDGN